MSTCALCGSPESKPVFRFLAPKTAEATGRPTEELYGRAGPLVRCTNCTLVRQDPPNEAPYEDAEDADYLVEDAGLRATFRKTIETIEKYRMPPGTLVDVGTGPGLLVDEANKKGWTGIGLEPSQWAVDVARGNGLDVRPVLLHEAGFEPGSLDAIVLSDVIEHVPDPKAVAGELFKLLKPGGVAFLATPDVDSVIAKTLRRWWWSVLPGHIFLFSRKTLTRLMQDAGFEVVEVTTHPKTFSLDYYAGRFTGYSALLGKVGRSVVKVFGGPTRLVSPDFRDRVALVARKP